MTELGVDPQGSAMQAMGTHGEDVLASQALLFSVIIGLVVGTLIGIVTEYRPTTTSQ